MAKKRQETKPLKRKTANTGNVHAEDVMDTKVKKKKIKVEVSSKSCQLVFRLSLNIGRRRRKRNKQNHFSFLNSAGSYTNANR